VAILGRARLATADSPSALPKGIDSIWIAIGKACWHWHPEAGWSVSNVGLRDPCGPFDRRLAPFVQSRQTESD
jgi:hypothetical protein